MASLVPSCGVGVVFWSLGFFLVFLQCISALLPYWPLKTFPHVPCPYPGWISDWYSHQLWTASMKVQAWICISRYIACVGVNDGEEFADILVILLQIYWTFRWWVIQLTICTAWDLNWCLASLAWGRWDEVLAHRVCTARAPDCWLLSPWATGIYSTAFFKILPSDRALSTVGS